jgi:hypothetical protein
MATFSYNGITYTAVYVDTTAGINGDGTSISTPFNVFPTFTAIAANTAIICRNGGQTSGYSFGTLTNANANILITGAPKVDEPLYSVVPGAATWGGDVADTFTVSFNGTQGFTSCWVFNNNTTTLSTIYLGRLTLQALATSGAHSVGGNAIVNCSAAYLTLYRCNIKAIGYSYNDSQDPGAGVVTPRCGVIFNPSYSSYSNYGDLIIDSCVIDLPGPSGVYNGSAGGNTYITNTIIQMWVATLNTQSVAYQGGSSSGYAYFKGSNFLTKSSKSNGSGGCQGISTTSFLDMNNCTCSVMLYAVSQNSGNVCAYILSSGYTIQNSTFTMQPYIAATYNAVLVQINSAGNTTLFRNCTFQTVGSNSLNQGVVYSIYPSSGCTSAFSSCLFNAAAILGNDTLATPPVLTFSNCTFLQGSFVCSSPLYVANLTSQNTGGGIVARNSAIYYIGTASFANASTKQINLFNSAKVFIDNLDINPASYINFNSSDSTALYVKNENGVVGNWTARSLKTNMVYSNTYRSGGASYSIKCQSNALPSNPVNPPILWIAPEPFAGIPVNIATPGTYLISLYFAYKLYDPADPVKLQNLILQSYFTNSLGINNSYHTSSRGSGTMIADGSTWNNDSGLTTMVLQNEVVVPAGITFPVTIYNRIGFFKYQTGFPSGYLVLDPYLVANPG